MTASEQLSPEQVDAALAARVTTVLELRSGVKVPALSDGPVAVLEAIRAVRHRLDRMEESISELLRLKGSLHRVARRAQEAVDDAWAESVSGSHRPHRGDFGEAAPRERYAQADLKVMEQRRTQRVHAELADKAAEAVEVAQLARWGLSDTRRDLHVMLRAVEVESSLER